jgi:hypothetical protein
MTKEDFQLSIYEPLLEIGYRDIKSANGSPYNAKDLYMCPQAPDLYLLTITPGKTELRKLGKNGYTAALKTQVSGPKDINNLHNEINEIILQGDTSNLDIKNSGCLVIFSIIITLTASLISKIF